MNCFVVFLNEIINIRSIRFELLGAAIKETMAVSLPPRFRRRRRQSLPICAFGPRRG